MKKSKRKGRLVKNFAEPLTGQDLLSFAAIANEMHEEIGEDNWSFQHQTIATAEVFSDDDKDTLKRVSLVMRMQALAQFMKVEDLPGWTRPQNDDGSVDTHEALFDAAATEPIRARKNEFGGDDLTFDKESFLKAAFRFAKESYDEEEI